MKRKTVLIALLLTTVSSYLPSKEISEDDPRMTFPVRPAPTKLHKMTGIFQEYGVGTNAGGLSIKLPNGKEVDFVTGGGAPMTFNGRQFFCWVPNYVKPDGTVEVNCDDWPKELVLGKTKVVVTYWYQKEYLTITDTDGTVKVYHNHYSVEKVTDQVDLAK